VAIQNPHTLPDESLAPAEDKQEETAEVLDRKSPMLHLPSPIPDRRADVMDLVMEYLTFLRWRSPKTAWVGTLKACIFAVKVRFCKSTFGGCVDGLLQTLSVVSLLPSRPVLLASVGFLAVLDTMFDGLEALLVLGVLHVVMTRWC
jgi:hypothetical protein